MKKINLSKKTIITIGAILGVLLITGIIGSGVYYYQSQKEKEQEEIIEVKASNYKECEELGGEIADIYPNKTCVFAGEEFAEDGPSNTYTNSNFKGFSFQYADGWKISGKEENNIQNEDGWKHGDSKTTITLEKSEYKLIYELTVDFPLGRGASYPAETPKTDIKKDITQFKKVDMGYEGDYGPYTEFKKISLLNGGYVECSLNTINNKDNLDCRSAFSTKDIEVINPEKFGENVCQYGYNCSINDTSFYFELM